MALQRTAVSRSHSSRYAVPLVFCPTAGRNSTLGLLSPSLVGGRADRPIFHLVLNWARNLYPYFANTERGEGPASPWLGAAMGDEAAMRGGNFGIGSRTNCNCANHASPSVRRPSVRPSFRPSIGYLPSSPLSPLRNPPFAHCQDYCSVRKFCGAFLCRPMWRGIPTHPAYASLINRDLISSMFVAVAAQIGCGVPRKPPPSTSPVSQQSRSGDPLLS